MAIETEFQILNTLLAEKAAQLAVTESQLFRIFCRCEGVDFASPEVVVTYPQRFDRTLQGKQVKLKAVHADNGGPMKGITLMALLRELNVQVSHSRPRTSNDNPFIESLFKTMKYRVNYPGRFEELSNARLWMAEFVHWYNTEHLHSAIGYVTPEQMRSGQAEAIFEQRNFTMRQAQATHPERWGSRPVKHWEVVREVILNPDEKE